MGNEMGDVMGDAIERLRPYGWPLQRLSEAMETVVRRAGLPHTHVEPVSPPLRDDRDPAALSQWIEAAAACLGVEVEPTEAPYGDIEAMVRGAAPALLLVPACGGEKFFLGVVRRNRRGSRLQLEGPGARRTWVSTKVVVRALTQGIEQKVAPEIEQLLEQAQVPERRRARARAAILRERLGQVPLPLCWMFRLPPGTSFWRQMVSEKLPRRLVGFFVGYVARYLMMIASWWVIGSAALTGHFDRHWLLAWVLLVISQVPLTVLVAWSQGLFAIGVGALLKNRLLAGALRLHPDQTRHQGAGQLLGRVIESGAVESMALSAGFNGAMACIEIIAAAVVLTIGPGGAVRLALFGGWILLTVLLGRRYYKRRLTWTAARLEMTNDLVERMVGHRTRLAQQRRELWHEGEDQLLARYLRLSTQLDTTLVRFCVLLSRGWIAVGLFGLIPVVLATGGKPLPVAVALGGLLLASRALESLSGSLAALTGAAVAWKQVAPLFRAAANSEPAGSPEVALALATTREDPADGQKLIEAQDLTFSYDQRHRVLDGCNLTVRRGDRLLLEGTSGGGKTTLASLLVGLRRPDSGLLLLRGLDRRTLGADSWRRHVVSAPQFHENHVMSSTFAFNLLMGRSWPAAPEDLEEAETICRELGLGPLLQRMPGGMLQVVGETGWRLSHGEQSRLFMARALLQGADVIVLDESFAALDPASLRQAMQCVQQRAPALLAIAHP